jgi:lipopolysaccharide transport system permease protein
MVQQAVSPVLTTDAAPSAHPMPVTHIGAGSRSVATGIRDLIHYRELLYFLAWRDMKVRYKQTALGAAWALLQPLFMMLIFTLLFSRLAKLPSPVPYPVFALSGLLPWQLFAFGLAESSNSLVMNERLLTKVYFPRLIVPFASVIAGLADFGISFVLLIVMMGWYHVVPSWTLLLVPVFVLMAVVTALAAGLWLSALNVQFRDVRYTLSFLTQFWLLGTPVAYAANIVPQPWRTLIALNPMTSVVEGFRWALLGRGERPGWMFALSATMIVIVFITGLRHFRRVEQSFADIV